MRVCADFYIDTKRFLENSAHNEAVGIAMDLVLRVWWPTKTAFTFDEEILAARLGKDLPARGYSADLLRRRRSELASFFTILPDGRWAPSVDYFSIADNDISASQ